MNRTKNRDKIINDPVHGFITVSGDLIYDLIEHPYFQRLRYIKQLGLTEYVYPGATHSRFQHSIGAYHLMSQALTTLREKGIEISEEEREAALLAILLHDIGHGPFSHALEFIVVPGINHEAISLLVMDLLNKHYDGRLSLAIEMFMGKYSRKFFHDLISSQIDMDRMDYLVRDSFFSGVIEGSVGSERIIKMLNVAEGRLVVDEKGIYSIEKFLIARRLMYWQVYMHKTVVSAERLLISIFSRVRELVSKGFIPDAPPHLKFFLELQAAGTGEKNLPALNSGLAQKYLMLDDNEILSSVRAWRNSGDSVLEDLCSRLLSRKLLAIELAVNPFNPAKVAEVKEAASMLMGLDNEALKYYVLTGKVSNSTYAPSAPRVRILTRKNGLKEITEVSDMLNHEALSGEITKHFLCYPKEIRENNKR